MHGQDVRVANAIRELRRRAQELSDRTLRIRGRPECFRLVQLHVLDFVSMLEVREALPEDFDVHERIADGDDLHRSVSNPLGVDARRLQVDRVARARLEYDLEHGLSVEVVEADGLSDPALH